MYYVQKIAYPYAYLWIRCGPLGKAPEGVAGEIPFSIMRVVPYRNIIKISKKKTIVNSKKIRT